MKRIKWRMLCRDVLIYGTAPLWIVPAIFTACVGWLVCAFIDTYVER